MRKVKIKKWAYNEPVFNESGEIIDNLVIEMNEHDILKECFESWSAKVAQVHGKYSEIITTKNCIDDWVANNWAWEVKDD